MILSCLVYVTTLKMSVELPIITIETTDDGCHSPENRIYHVDCRGEYISYTLPCKHISFNPRIDIKLSRAVSMLESYL